MEEKFWNWFLNNKHLLENYIDCKSNSLDIIDLLNERIFEYNSLLFAEITSNTDGSYVLILTCDGRAKGVYPLTKLAHFAPDVQKWSIQQFRKPGRVFELNYMGLELRADDFRFKHWLEMDENHIDIYIPRYRKEDERFSTLALLYLDHFIGEYEVITKIESVGFKKLTLFTRKKTLINLKQLSEIINN